MARRISRVIGDVGTGDSDLTWQALAAVNYRFEKVGVVVGYRYLDYDFDDSDVFDDLNLSGPFVGVKFRFWVLGVCGDMRLS